MRVSLGQYKRAAKLDRMKKDLAAYEMHQAGFSFSEIGRRWGVTGGTISVRIKRHERTLIYLNAVKGVFRAHTARIDATQPDDPPRGVWVE
jgi:IS30 family transposase